VVVFSIPVKGSLGTIKSRIGKSDGKEVQLTLASKAQPYLELASDAGKSEAS